MSQQSRDNLILVPVCPCNACTCPAIRERGRERANVTLTQVARCVSVLLRKRWTSVLHLSSIAAPFKPMAASTSRYRHDAHIPTSPRPPPLRTRPLTPMKDDNNSNNNKWKTIMLERKNIYIIVEGNPSGVSLSKRSLAFAGAMSHNGTFKSMWRADGRIT